MKRNILCCILLIFFFGSTTLAQNQYRREVKPTKNVILMIPDGTSLSVHSAARWYQIYNKLGGDQLAADPYLCGTVKTYSSDAPIGDSAPTTSCYMTGYLSQAGNVSIYPVPHPEQDIHPIDPTRSYQPLTTVLEAAKYDLKKSTGVVATLQFTHATPADCASHHYSRGANSAIASQMAGNNLDVVIGGGVSYLHHTVKEYLEKRGTKILLDDITAFREYDAEQNLWALFEASSLPYDLDRDPNKIPSLEEMTRTAISRLSKNENGFFLMVEGSQVDWAGHANDAVGMITEYLAFNKAVQAAIDFAKEDKNTTVVIVSDHGTGGFAFGQRGFTDYARRGLDDAFANISKYKATARHLQSILIDSKPEEFRTIIKEYTDLDITDEELETLLSSQNYKEGDYTNVSNNLNLEWVLSDIMNSRTPFGFTTGGHTGEEVLLAVYHPEETIPIGMNTNVELNKYLCDVVGLKRPLDDITEEIFVKHTDVFEGMNFKIDISGRFPVLTVTNGKKKLVVPAYASVATLDNETFDLGSVTVYIDKNDTFYLPSFLRDKISSNERD